MGPSYTCCEAADVNRDYRPGETLTIHWIVVPGEAGTPATQVELTARLTGPYATVTDLKTAASPGMGVAGASTFVADPIRPSGQAGEQPVSVILIPPTAAPGFYNLIHTVDQPGGSAGGASIIQVKPHI